MPEISKRSANAYDSPIRKLTPFAVQAEEAGKKVYYLNIGQPDIETPQAALDVVRQADLKILKYAPSQGNRSYREELVHYYKRFGYHVSPNDILVTNGASEAILFLLMACLDVGEEVIMPEPLYANYLGFAEVAYVGVKPLTSTIDTAFDLPDLIEFERAITKKTRAILICNPNNPTGRVYSEEKLRAIATLAKKHDLYLFVDEVYSEFCYDEDFFSVLNIEGLGDHVAVIDSISKRFSACGARIGSIICRNPKVIQAVMKFAQFRLSAPTMAQLFAEALLKLDDSYIKSVKEEYQRRRNTLFQRLSKMDEVVCYQPGGAFYVFAQLPIDNSDRFCRWLLEEFDYKGATLMLASGSGFYASENLGQQEVRLAYVLNEMDIHKAMDVLEQALLVYPGRTKVLKTVFST